MHVTHGWRSLRKSPAFTWSVVLLLGLGVGSMTTIFALVDFLLLRPLPYVAPERLFSVEGLHAGPDWDDLRRLQSRPLWAAARARDANLTGIERPQRLRLAEISPDFFRVFPTQPILGRLFVADDVRSGDRVLLSHGAWQRLFGADPLAIGRTAIIQGLPVVIVGVLEASFLPPSPLVGDRVDVWRALDPSTDQPYRRDAQSWRIAGRLQPSTSLDALTSEVNVLADSRARAFPEQYVDRSGHHKPIPVTDLQTAAVGRVQDAGGLWVLFTAVALLLLVAATNVALLFLARGLARLPEIAVRRALGAGTSSVLEQLLVESLMVSTAGALLGVGLTIVLLRGLRALSPDTLPSIEAVAIDTRVLVFALAVALATSLIFGVWPALGLARKDLLGTLHHRARGQTAGRAARRASTTFVIAQMALSLVLVSQSLSLLRGVAQFHRDDPGFDLDGVWTVPLSPEWRNGSEDWVRRAESIRASLAATAGVRDATYGITMPLEFTGGNRCCWNNRPSFSGVRGATSVAMHPVDANYFDLLRLRLIAGTAWTRLEQTATPRPAVMTDDLAAQSFGAAAGAIGREMRLANMDFRIVGVVASDRHFGLDQPSTPSVYLPITALAWAGRSATNLAPLHMAVRVDRADDGLAGRLREAVWQADANLPVPTVRPLAEWASASTARAQIASLVFAGIASAALLLVAAGLCGTLLYGVGQRRRELGIRLAIGAAPTGLQALVIWQAVRVVAVGLTIGVVAAWLAGRLMGSRIAGVPPDDPTAIAAALAILLGVALFASWLPARTAASTDPIEALRAE